MGRPAVFGAADASERASEMFLRTGAFFSCILSEFLKNLVALHSVLSLLRAVEWCIKNKIEIINLSLGSTAYNDQELLQSLSNRLEEHKICLVAATANNGQTTYPANFRNVIGVRYCDLLTADQHKYFQNPSDGIEIISGCPTNINQICFDPCNSFATAIISSKVCNFYQTELNHPYDKTRKYLMDTAL